MVNVGMKSIKQPFEFMGVKFAPLVIPFERRLQTLCASMIISTWLIVPFVTIGLMVKLLLIENFRWIPVLYIALIIYEKDISCKGGRRNVQWFRDLKIWKYCADYHPISLIKTCHLDPERNYLMGYHPHGVFVSGACALTTNACNWDLLFPGIKRRHVCLDVGFHVPGFRELFLSTGCISSSKEAIKHCLSKPRNGVTSLVVGGAQEALQGEETVVELTLNNRKGFVKLALETGSDLLPCFAFGECQIYNMVSPKGSRLRKFQEFMKKIIKVSPVVFSGRGIFQYSFGLLPFRKPINVVIGAPIPVEKCVNPSRDQVNELHANYISSLRRLYEEYNAAYGDPEIRLAIS